MTTNGNERLPKSPPNESEQAPLDADAREYQRRIAAISEQRRVREAKVAEADKKQRDEITELNKRLATPFDREAYERESREAIRVREESRNADRAKLGLPPDYSSTESMEPKAKMEEPDLTDLSVERLAPEFMAKASRSWANKDFDNVIDLALNEAYRLGGNDQGDADDQMWEMKTMSKLVGKMEDKSFEDFLAAFITLERFDVYKRG